MRAIEIKDWDEAGRMGINAREAADAAWVKEYGLDHLANGPKSSRLIRSSREFVATYVPPDYVIHGVVQRNRLYALTGRTGSGKTAVELAMAHSVATGLSIGGHEVEKGRVLYMAGENPDDVKGRWLAMAQHLDFDPDKIDVDFIEGVFSLSERTEDLLKEAKDPYTLVLVDTSAAFFEGDEFNDNKQQLVHALKLRRLTEIYGRPAIIVGCHPVKNATENNLVPYGGGSFLNELDGNLTAVNSNMVAEIHWQAKFRGPDFEPMHFELRVVTATKLRDSQSRPIPTVMAQSLTDQCKEQLKATARSNEDAVLIYMEEHPGQSLRDVADGLKWKAGPFAEPYSTKVKRALVNLRKDKFAEVERDRWQLTAKGKAEAKRIAKEAE
jgi:hypothetical protein